MTQLIPSSLVSGNGAIQTYKRNGLELTTQGVEEMVIIQTGAIAANAKKIIALSDYRLYLKLISVYVTYITQPNNYTIAFEALYNGNPIFNLALNGSNLPYKFPDVILTPDLDIRINPSINIAGLICYAKQISVVDRIIFN